MKTAKKYFTGKPCIRGHVVERLVSNHACIECALEYNRRWKKNNPDKRRAYRSDWKKKNPDKVNAAAAKRRSLKISAIPPWADLGKIKEIYAYARHLIKLNNKLYHVDHIIPLNHPLVCGLHVHHNLRVLTDSDNLKKGNSIESELRGGFR